MTVILLGRVPQGNFMVTDALVSDPSVKIRSFNDCQLGDKISTLSSAKSYYSLVGDATIVKGITDFDWWCMNKNISIDFARKDVMQNALETAETYIQMNEKLGSGSPAMQYTNVYFIDRDRVYEYIVGYIRKKYIIDTFRIFSDMEVLLNYSGTIKKIFNFDYPNNQLFKKATEFIDSAHIANKQSKKPYTLEYDFNDRFCGVVFSKNKMSKEKLYSPYKTLSEAIGKEMFPANEFWKLVQDKEFEWSPKI